MGNRKRLFKGSTGFLLVVVMLFAVLATAWAYSIISIEGDIAVTEGITVDQPLTYSVELQPNEVDDRVFTLRNSGDVGTHVVILGVLDPEDGGVELELSVEEVIVPGNGFIEFHAIVSTDNDVLLGAYSVDIEIHRDPTNF